MMDDRDLERHLREGGDDVWRPSAPPELDLDAIIGATPPPARARRRTIRLRPMVLAAGAMACVAAGVVGGALVFGREASPGPNVVASAGPSPLPTQRREVSLDRFDRTVPRGAVAQASIFTATDGRTVDLRVRGLDAPPKGDFYELWVLGNAGKMVSLGVVRVDADGAAHVRVPLPVSLHRFPIFDISLESGDGDPTHSGHSVLRSAAAA